MKIFGAIFSVFVLGLSLIQPSFADSHSVTCTEGYCDIKKDVKGGKSIKYKTYCSEVNGSTEPESLKCSTSSTWMSIGGYGSSDDNYRWCEAVNSEWVDKTHHVHLKITCSET